MKLVKCSFQDLLHLFINVCNENKNKTMTSSLFLALSACHSWHPMWSSVLQLWWTIIQLLAAWTKRCLVASISPGKRTWRLSAWMTFGGQWRTMRWDSKQTFTQRITWTLLAAWLFSMIVATLLVSFWLARQEQQLQRRFQDCVLWHNVCKMGCWNVGVISDFFLSVRHCCISTVFSSALAGVFNTCMSPWCGKLSNVWQF